MSKIDMQKDFVSIEKLREVFKRNPTMFDYLIDKSEDEPVDVWGKTITCKGLMGKMVIQKVYDIYETFILPFEENGIDPYTKSQDETQYIGLGVEGKFFRSMSETPVELRDDFEIERYDILIPISNVIHLFK